MNQANSSEISTIEDDEIDLKEILDSIYRKKFYFLTLSSLTILVGFIYAFTRKPVWEGHFQIVMRDKSGRVSSSSQGLGDVISSFGLEAGGIKNDLKTEVKILESPSILKPIYDFVKSSKLESGLDVSKWTFYRWTKNLKVDLEKGTSVLNLEYRDTDKSLIIPVLKKISNTYQAYSESDREKEISQGIAFLEKQIEIMKVQSTDSLTKFQNFSLENGLGNRDGLPMPLNSQEMRVPGVGEMPRLGGFSNQIINTDQLTGNIPFSYQLNDQNLQKNNNRYDVQYAKLSELESDLIEKSTKLKPNSKYIISLKERIEALKTSLSRTPEILLKYRQLRYEAKRDENLLDQLQSSYSTLQLKEAQQTDPWRVITEPTLIDSPVAPRKKRIVGLYLLAGVFLGSALSLLLDRRSGRIYNINFFKEIIKYPLLKTLSISSNNWSSSIALLTNRLKENGIESIAVVPVGESFNEEHFSLFTKALHNEMPQISITVSNDLIKTSTCSNQLLVLAPGSCTRDHLNQVQEDLSIQKGTIAGWIYLCP